MQKLKKQKMQKKYQTLKKFYSLVSLTWHFTKFIFLAGAANRHAPVQYAKYFFFFFLSSHRDTNPLLRLYHFRKKYNYILVNINSDSSRVIFSFFFFFFLGGGGASSSGSNIFVPQQIL